MNYDFLIIGGGVFGITAAIELRRRKHKVGLLDDGIIPNPLAASTDISKAVRMEYGTDLFYMDMADRSIDGWKSWNDLFATTLYHETGYLLTCKNPLDDPSQFFEKSSYENLIARGHKPERVDASEIAKRFPSYNSEVYIDGFFQPRAGYAEAAKTVSTLRNYALELGVEIHEEQRTLALLMERAHVRGAKTLSGTFEAGHVVVCAGTGTPYLVEDLIPNMKITGHPVFHLDIRNKEDFSPPKFVVFAADISNSGWYGFPLHPTENVLKMANHGVGVNLHPVNDERIVTDTDMENFRKFLRETFPAIADNPIVYTRRCLYSDTLDEHFWIDQHPEIQGLSVGSGGSGHGLKMAPVIGEMIADAAEGHRERVPDRFHWRSLDQRTMGEEEARFSG